MFTAAGWADPGAGCRAVVAAQRGSRVRAATTLLIMMFFFLSWVQDRRPGDNSKHPEELCPATNVTATAGETTSSSPACPPRGPRPPPRWCAWWTSSAAPAREPPAPRQTRRPGLHAPILSSQRMCFVPYCNIFLKRGDL